MDYENIFQETFSNANLMGIPDTPSTGLLSHPTLAPMSPPPTSYSIIDPLECIQQSYTSKIDGFQNLSCQERIKL